MNSKTIKITQEFIDPQLSSFWGWKEGKKLKKMKKFWFILSTNRLYYFQSPNSSEAKGEIIIAEDTIIIEHPEMHVENSKYFFSIKSFSQKGKQTKLLCVQSESNLKKNILEPITAMINSLKEKSEKFNQKKNIPSLKIGTVNTTRPRLISLSPKGGASNAFAAIQLKENPHSTYQQRSPRQDLIGLRKVPSQKIVIKTSNQHSPNERQSKENEQSKGKQNEFFKGKII